MFNHAFSLVAPAGLNACQSAARLNFYDWKPAGELVICSCDVNITTKSLSFEM